MQVKFLNKKMEKSLWSQVFQQVSPIINQQVPQAQKCGVWTIIILNYLLPRGVSWIQAALNQLPEKIHNCISTMTTTTYTTTTTFTTNNVHMWVWPHGGLC